MIKKPLKFIKGHLFTELEGDLWLIDTGAPQSFGQRTQLEVAGEGFTIRPDYMGLNADALSELAGVQCVGLKVLTQVIVKLTYVFYLWVSPADRTSLMSYYQKLLKMTTSMKGAEAEQ